MTDYMLNRLRTQHASLEHEIAREMHSRAPDVTRLINLKKEKLRVRERIEEILRGETAVA